MFYLTPQEKKIILFITFLIFLGAFLKSVNFYPKDEISIERKITKININQAGIKELEKLPYIGRKIAQRIIEYREKKGKIENFEDLLNIKGIGRKKLSLIRRFISF